MQHFPRVAGPGQAVELLPWHVALIMETRHAGRSRMLASTPKMVWVGTAPKLCPRCGRRTISRAMPFAARPPASERSLLNQDLLSGLGAADGKEPGPRTTTLSLIVRRFLVPSFVVTLWAFIKWRAKISMRAEVELSRHLEMGTNCTVSSFTKIKASDGPLKMGERCSFGTGCFIATGRGGVIMGNNVIFGPNSVVVAVNYRYEKVDVPLKEQGVISRGVRIGNNVWVGASSVILDGTVLGDNCIVVAGSLVNRRFPANCIIQGNPAKIVLRRTVN
jgi:acetyltransferase-like isoleucine patch superfamily enzyme